MITFGVFSGQSLPDMHFALIDAAVIHCTATASKNKSKTMSLCFEREVCVF